jgi:23S rRNA (uridine2552-2'-O)-methyltransferase
MPEGWLQKREKEFYYRKAKEEGYRSRAAYKLKQLNNRFQFFKGALTVLDLGAAPGGWLQVASEEIPEEGLVVGVDLDEIESLYRPNVETIMGDMRDPEILNRINKLFQGKIDVILSDMAPNVSGVWELDQYRQIHLARLTLKIADQILRRNGWIVVKTFQGSEHAKYVKDVKNMFRKVVIVKPKASRKQSSEVYIVAHKLRKDRRLPSEIIENSDC